MFLQFSFHQKRQEIKAEAAIRISYYLFTLMIFPDKYIIYEMRNVFNGTLNKDTISCEKKIAKKLVEENAHTFMSEPKISITLISKIKQANETW